MAQCGLSFRKHLLVCYMYVARLQISHYTCTTLTRLISHVVILLWCMFRNGRQLLYTGSMFAFVSSNTAVIKEPPTYSVCCRAPPHSLHMYIQSTCSMHHCVYVYRLICLPRDGSLRSMYMYIPFLACLTVRT